MTKHTPGPCSRAEIVEGGVLVPTTGTVQSIAIRSLVIAVPDLLAALKELDVCVMRFGLTLADDDARHAATTIALFAAMEKARAAVRKAEPRWRRRARPSGKRRDRASDQVKEAAAVHGRPRCAPSQG